MSLPTRVFVPNLMKPEFDEALDDAKDVDKELLILQGRAARLVAGIPEDEVAPGVLAWMALWSRVFQLLDGARAALSRNNLYALTMIGRAADESSLQLQLICDARPIQPGIDERLAAWLAWSIWSDRRTWQMFLKPEHLAAYWSPEPARSLAKNPKVLAYEKSIGPVELANEHELEADRQSQEKKLRELLNRLDTALDDPALRLWVPRLNELSGKKQSAVSFFDLFDEQTGGEPKGIFGRLKRIDRTSAYPIYAKASGVVHGSSLEPFLTLTEEIAVPQIPGRSARVDTEAGSIRGHAGAQLTLLEFIKHHWTGAA